jgi:hypothetical protein
MTLNDWVEILGVTTTAGIVIVCVWLIFSEFWRGDR